ncbi:MAG TPA: thermonuclease family protein [Ramlibacter sp.]|jgi:endonuclease YncB( thermonuclease family)
MTALQRLTVALALLVPWLAHAENYPAVVSHVTDGDTVWVRPVSGGPPQHIRIDGIDAPELCQRFGPESRSALASYVLHKRVVVLTRGADDYRRTVARLHIGRKDVGAWMVSHGYAWSYRFRSDPGPYARIEARARSAGRGLWAQGDAEIPRDFRVRHGSCH